MRIVVWHKESSHQGSTSRCWWRVGARQEEEEEARSTCSLYRRLSYSIPLFCFRKFFLQTVCLLHSTGQRNGNIEKRSERYDFTQEKRKGRSGDKPAVEVHIRFQSLLGLMNTL